jgi:hypothetical protein
MTWFSQESVKGYFLCLELSHVTRACAEIDVSARVCSALSGSLGLGHGDKGSSRH